MEKLRVWLLYVSSGSIVVVLTVMVGLREGVNPVSFLIAAPIAFCTGCIGLWLGRTLS